MDISKVVTLCKLLESLLLVSKSVDLNAEASKLNPIICSTFVFCYLWSIGGNITDTYWDAFDSFVRRQFEDTPDAKVCFVVVLSTAVVVQTERLVRCVWLSVYGLGSLVVRASDLRLYGREFDPRPPHYRSVSTGIDDRLWAGIPRRYVTSHPGQLSLLPSVGREMSTGLSALMRCG